MGSILNLAWFAKSLCCVFSIELEDAVASMCCVDMFMHPLITLRAQFRVEIEAIARSDFNVDGHGLAIPDHDRDP